MQKSAICREKKVSDEIGDSGYSRRKERSIIFHRRSTEMLSRIIAALFVILLITQVRPSRADAFTYTFVAGSAGQLSFESPTILTADTIVPSSSVVTNIADLASFEINPIVGQCEGTVGPGVSCAGIVFSNSDGFFIFFDVPLNAMGVFGSDDETLTISQTPDDLSAVPEPATIAFLTIGMAISALALRSRTIRSFPTV
jgi:hypothetical protein